MRKLILVTGASSGIGREVCKVFLQNDWNVIAIARRLNLLKSLKANNLIIAFNFISLTFHFKYNLKG